MTSSSSCFAHFCATSQRAARQASPEDPTASPAAWTRPGTTELPAAASIATIRPCAGSMSCGVCAVRWAHLPAGLAPQRRRRPATPPARSRSIGAPRPGAGAPTPAREARRSRAERRAERPDPWCRGEQRERPGSGNGRRVPETARPDRAAGPGARTGPRKGMEEEEQDADHRAAGSQGSQDQAGQDQDARAEGLAAAPGRLHARVHDHAQEAELRAAQGLPGPAHRRRRGHRVHPGGRPQPAGALHRAGARRPGEGPPRRPLQGHPRHARHPGRARPQAGPLALRRQGQAGLGGGAMPRKGPAARRPLTSDPIYQSQLVTQLINKILLHGKRSTAERIVYSALEQTRRKTGNDPVTTLKRAVENAKPVLETRPRRVGGATYQVPIEVRPARSTTLALRWIVNFSKARREKTMADRLAAELLDASNGAGAAVKRREDTHKMAEANRAFAHYRW